MGKDGLGWKRPQPPGSEHGGVGTVPDLKPARDLLVGEWLQLQYHGSWREADLVSDHGPAGDDHRHRMAGLCLAALEFADLLQVVVSVHGRGLDKFIEPV